jgi:hypothetical protein
MCELSGPLQSLENDIQMVYMQGREEKKKRKKQSFRLSKTLKIPDTRVYHATIFCRCGTTSTMVVPQTLLLSDLVAVSVWVSACYDALALSNA